MKNLVSLWGWVVFYPVLAPIIALPILVFLGRTIRSLSAKVNTALLFFSVCLLLGGIAYGNLRYGRDLFFEFLKTKGESHLAKVSDVRRSSKLSGGGSLDVSLLYNSPVTGEMNVTVPLNAARVLPDIEGLDVPPEIGDTVSIYVYPRAETVLMIDGDPKKSTYGAKLQCVVLQRRYERTQLRLKASDFPTADIREAYIQAIKDLLETTCPNLEQRNHLRGLLSTYR